MLLAWCGSARVTADAWSVAGAAPLSEGLRHGAHLGADVVPARPLLETPGTYSTYCVQI